jgi:hypothetical protein
LVRFAGPGAQGLRPRVIPSRARAHDEETPNGESRPWSCWDQDLCLSQCPCLLVLLHSHLARPWGWEPPPPVPSGRRWLRHRCGDQVAPGGSRPVFGPPDRSRPYHSDEVFIQSPPGEACWYARSESDAARSAPPSSVSTGTISCLRPVLGTTCGLRGRHAGRAGRRRLDVHMEAPPAPSQGGAGSGSSLVPLGLSHGSCRGTPVTARTASRLR